MTTRDKAIDALSRLRNYNYNPYFDDSAWRTDADTVWGYIQELESSHQQTCAVDIKDDRSLEASCGTCAQFACAQIVPPEHRNDALICADYVKSPDVVVPRSNWAETNIYFPLGLNFEGCSCSEGLVEGTFIRTHCHRSGSNGCSCRYAGVHFVGDRHVALKVADYIANAYCTEVTVVEYERPELC